MTTAIYMLFLLARSAIIAFDLSFPILLVCMAVYAKKKNRDRWLEMEALKIMLQEASGDAVPIQDDWDDEE